jgi:hypothetical protein
MADHTGLIITSITSTYTESSDEITTPFHETAAPLPVQSLLFPVWAVEARGNETDARTGDGSEESGRY